MKPQGQTLATSERVSHAGLLCVYTLAAVLGLFLHTTGEVRAFGHVRGARGPDLEQDDAPGRSDRDESRRAPSSVFARLSLALPESRSVFLASTSLVVHRSRAPPVPAAV